jgi:hypothetical protein
VAAAGGVEDRRDDLVVRQTEHETPGVQRRLHAISMLPAHTQVPGSLG